MTQTGLWISIYDLDTPGYVVICGSGSTCGASVTQAAAATHHYVARMSHKPLPPVYPPPTTDAVSSTVAVTWQAVTVSLTASATTTGVSTASTLTATASADVGETASYLEIFKVTDTSAPALLTSCGSGTTCSIGVTETREDTDSFIAYISNYSSSYPPPGILATSATNWVSWSNEGATASLNTTTTPGTARMTFTAPTTIPFDVEIFDENTGTAVRTCGPNPPSPCSFVGTTAGHHYVAFVSVLSADTALPPTNAVANSNIAVGV